MREILFRGKAINRISGRQYRTNYKNGDWVYGLIERLYDDDFPNIPATMRNTDGVSDIDIDFATVGQYTGLTDKNGKKIFEGDIVQLNFEGTSYNHDENGRRYEEDYYGYKIGVVAFGSNGTFLNAAYGELWVNGEDVEGWIPTRRSRIAGYRSEAIGNIHDNPELLKGGAE